MAGRRANQSDIWTLDVSIPCMQDTCEVIPGPFCVFPIFNNLVSQKWQVLERNILSTPKSVCYPVLFGHCLPS